MGGIFGSPGQNKSSSKNVNNPMLVDSFGPATQFTGNAGNLIQNLLSGNSTGFNSYKDATGFDFMGEQGSRGITGNAAARGLLRSGGTGKALVQYGNDLQQTYADNYIKDLLGLGQLGLGSGQILAQSGQVSKNKPSKSGLGNALGIGLNFLGA